MNCFYFGTQIFLTSFMNMAYDSLVNFYRLYLIFQALNEGLLDLDLSWNSLRNKGAETIANALIVSKF